MSMNLLIELYLARHSHIIFKYIPCSGKIDELFL